VRVAGTEVLRDLGELLSLLYRPALLAAALRQHVARHSLELTRLGTALSVIAFAAFLSHRFAGGHRIVRMVTIGYLGAFGGLFLLQHPEVGVAGLIVASLLLRFGIGTGTQSSIGAGLLIVIGMTALWLLDMIVRERRLELLPSRPVRPLLLFVGLSIMAFGFGQLNWLPTAPAPLRAQLGGTAVFVLSAAAFLVVAHRVRTEAWLARLTWLFLGCAAIYIAGSLYPPLRWVRRYFIEPSATGSLFWTWLMALTTSQALFNRQLHVGGRLVLGGLAAGTLLVAFGPSRQAWTSGWLPAVVAMGVTIAVARPKLILLVIPAGLVGLLLNSQTVSELLWIGDNQYSFLTRLEAWTIVLEITKVSPLFGLGPANYYWYTPLFPILGYAVQFNSHSNYVDIIAQIGLLGLASFLWFAWELGQLSWQLRGVLPDGFSRAYVYGALGGLAGTLVSAALGDWVLPFVYNIGLDGMRSSILGWVFLGGVLVLEGIHTNRTAYANSQQTEG